MKRKLTAVIAFALCLLILTACENPDVFSDKEKLTGKYTRNKDITITYNYADGAADPPNAYNDFSSEVISFSLKELSALSSQSGESFVFSPASTALQLSMLTNAASPETRQDILLAFGGSAGADGLNTGSSYFKSRMESVSKTGLKKSEKPKTYVKLGGAMLIDGSIDVKTAFLQNVKDYYGYDVFRYDFDGKSADKKLADYLKPYTSKSGISPDDDTVNLVSATEIKDLWLEAYSSDAEAGIFKGGSGEKEMDFFRSNETKISSDKAVGVVKYTAGNPLKLVLIMPKEGTSVEEYLKSLSSEEYDALMNSVDITKKTTAVIPEFSIESPAEAVDLSKALTASGFGSLFEKKSSFSALSFNTDFSFGEMYEIQPGFSFGKNGVNAAKLTPDSRGAELQKTDDEVVFDRPFIFLLADNETNIPIQAGVYR